MDKLEKDMVFVLNPYYRLRSDQRRSVIYSKSGDGDSFSHEWCSCIHPFHAVMLSFFTRYRTLGENIRMLAKYFFREEEEFINWISIFLNNPKPIQFHPHTGIIHFPKKVLIPIGEVQGDYPYREIDPNDFLWSHLDLSTRRLYLGPIQVTFMLDNHCETHCKYCYADTQTQVAAPLSTARILELVNEAARIPVGRVNLMGGEVFLHPDWDEILKELVRLDIAPGFLSTKMPPDATLIEKLQATGYKGILQISLDAVDANVLHESIGAPDNYLKRMLDGLRLLDRSGIHFQVATILTKYNADLTVLLSLYKELALLHNIRDWRIVPVYYSFTKGAEVFQRLRVPKDAALSLFDELENEIARQNKFPVILGCDILSKEFFQTDGGSQCFKGKECSALTNHMFILPDGKVTICEQLYWTPRFIIGDVVQSSLIEVWNSEKAMALWKIPRSNLSESSACKQCVVFDKCYAYQNRCWSDIVKAYGEEHWDYPDPRCKYAPQMNNQIGYIQN